MTKLYRVLGKRGRITIPYEIRQRVGFSYNDVLSFTEAPDGRTVTVKREKICDNCSGTKTADKETEMTLEDFLDSLSADAPTLISLDEILRGTNSLDKLNGSRMFLRAMEKEPVTGIIATHDLELSKMEQESPVFHNFCFEIALGNDVTYSYKITPGVARNQNASFLLRKLLGPKAADSNTAEETAQDGHHNEKN